MCLRANALTCICEGQTVAYGSCFSLHHGFWSLNPSHMLDNYNKKKGSALCFHPLTASSFTVTCQDQACSPVSEAPEFSPEPLASQLSNCVSAHSLSQSRLSDSTQSWLREALLRLSLCIPLSVLPPSVWLIVPMYGLQVCAQNPPCNLSILWMKTVLTCVSAQGCRGLCCFASCALV